MEFKQENFNIDIEVDKTAGNNEVEESKAWMFFFWQNTRGNKPLKTSRTSGYDPSRKRPVFQNTKSFQVKSLYSRISIKRSPIKRQTYIRRPAAKVLETELSAIH